jgi:clan AA aspartic protease
MEKNMGKFTEEVTLTNMIDQCEAGRGLIPESTIRQVTVRALVDTGVMTLCLDEATSAQLGLGITGTRPARVADGRRVESKVTTPVGIRWKDRYATCNARVLPGAANILLGAIPLEELDLMVDPVRQCLAGIHGDEPLDEID